MRHTLPLFLSLGCPEERFWTGTPEDLKPYVKAQEMRNKRADRERWEAGIYTLSAVSTAVSRALAGKKSRAEYMPAPLMEQARREQTDTTTSDAEMFAAYAAAFNADRARNEKTDLEVFFGDDTDSTDGEG